MRTVLADERGRITLGMKIVDRLGRKFAVVAAGGEVVLVPIAKDPIAELGKIGKAAGMDKYTLSELKREIREEAERQAGK